MNIESGYKCWFFGNLFKKEFEGKITEKYWNSLVKDFLNKVHDQLMKQTSDYTKIRKIILSEANKLILLLQTPTFFLYLYTKNTVC
jgi:hypothetical protein